MANSKGNVGKSQWLQVGEILVSKANNLYIKIKEDVELKSGTQLMIQNPREKIQNMVSEGRLSEDEGMQRLSKIPDFVKYNIVLPPSKE